MRGVYYSETAGRHKLFGERLGALREKGYDIKNCSLMGATVETGCGLIEKKLTSPAADTTVIFEYGGNDCDFQWNDISADPLGEYTPNTPLETYVEKYGKCIEYAKELGADVKICNLVPIDSEKYMSWISRNRNEANIRAWLGDTSMLYRWQEYYNRAAETLARRLSCDLIDIRTPFLLSHNYSSLLSSDGIHPTVEGHYVIDGLVAEQIACAG